MPDRRNKEISTASMKDSSRADGQLETDVNNSKHPKPGAADMETIASLSIHDQVDALAQALLREFMHRRGYTKTLQAFDRECPRNDRTIASRQLMRKLLEIPSPAFPSKLSGDNNSNSADFGGGGKDSAVMTNGGKEEEKENKKKKKKVPPTYMEELCSYRLQKRELQQWQKQATENNRKKKTGEEGIEVEMIIDPSDAEMEKWRASAAERERCIQETRERHEELLQKRHERKKRKKEKLKKRREEKRGKKEIDEDVNDFNRIAATSNASRSDRHGKHRVRFAVGDDDSNDEEVDLASANNSNSNNNNEDALAPVKSRNLEMCGGGGGSGNVIAEPEFLLGRLDKRRSNRSAGTAVGSHWTPSGGGLAEVTGGSRGASFSPDPFTLTTNSITTTSSTSSEKQPSFLLGEGMSLMSERMQATKKHSALDDWSSTSPSPFSTLRGSNNINNIISSIHGSSPASVGSDGTSGGLLVGARSMRGGAGFTPGATSGAWLKPHSAREGSLSGSFSCIPAPATAPHFSTAGQRVVSHGGGGPHSPHTAADAFTIPPPPPSGILKTRAEGGRQGGYDGMARPTSSAMRQNSTGNTNNNSINNNNNGVNGDAANGGGGGGSEIEAKRKKRKVTILMD